MAVVSYLFDDAGRIWDTGSSQLRSDLDGFEVGDFPEYVVRNMGFIRVDRRRSSATIWLRPETVALTALDGVASWLGDEKIDRVLVNSYSDGRWQHRIMAPAPSGAYAALRQLQPSAPALPDQADHTIARVVDTTEIPAKSPLAQALALWRDTGGNWRKLALVSGLGAAVQHRYTLFEIHGDRSFVLRGFGGGLPGCAKTWMEKTVGSCIYDHPDRSYIWSCVDSYRKVVETGEPELQEIDAFVSWPGAERQRRRYRRLLLPLSDGSRSMYLLSVTAEDASIDLRAAI